MRNIINLRKTEGICSQPPFFVLKYRQGCIGTTLIKQDFKTGQVQALVSGVYDILNHFYLDIEIEHISVSENELAKRNLKH